MRVAFPCLASILLGSQLDITAVMLMEAFRECLNPVESISIQEAFACKSGSFPQTVVNKLISLLSRFDCLETPKPANLLRLCEESARYLFITKPYAVIVEMAMGIPVQHRQFWTGKTVHDFHRLFGALCLNQKKVIESIEEPLLLCPSEQRVFGYSTQFVSCLRVDELQKFLRFCTGSSVCIGMPITIAFNNSSGLGRRPVAHTCNCLLELSRSYSSYHDFTSEFTAILSSEENGWLIDAI